MSAPWEVYVLLDHKDRATGARFDGKVPDAVRCLNSQLTCGECAKHGQHNQCPHDYHNHDSVNERARRHCWPNHGVPACMAFVPKEPK